MMNDDYYDDSDQQRTSSNLGRWVVFVVVLILGVISIYGIMVYGSYEMIFLYMFIYIPMIVFLLYATYRWAQGRSIVHTDISEDERILESMRKHALPVESGGLGGMVHCSNCGMDFDIGNAMPVEKDVFFCPYCKTRLHIQ